MKEVSFKELESRNFDYKGISNYTLYSDECVRCKNSYSYSKVKKFLRNRNKLSKKHLWNSCQRCWLIINTSEDEDWRKKE